MMKKLKTMFTSPVRGGDGSGSSTDHANEAAHIDDPLSPGAGADFDTWYQRQFSDTKTVFDGKDAYEDKEAHHSRSKSAKPTGERRDTGTINMNKSRHTKQQQQVQNDGVPHIDNSDNDDSEHDDDSELSSASSEGESTGFTRGFSKLATGSGGDADELAVRIAAALKSNNAEEIHKESDESCKSTQGLMGKNVKPDMDNSSNDENPAAVDFKEENRAHSNDSKSIVRITESGPSTRMQKQHIAMAHLMKDNEASQTNKSLGADIKRFDQPDIDDSFRKVDASRDNISQEATEKDNGSIVKLLKSSLSRAAQVESSLVEAADFSPHGEILQCDNGSTQAVAKDAPSPSRSEIGEMIPAIRELSMAVRDAVLWAEDGDTDSSDDEISMASRQLATAKTKDKNAPNSGMTGPVEISLQEQNEKLQKAVATLIKERDEARATCVRLCQEAARNEFRQPKPDNFRVMNGNQGDSILLENNDSRPDLVVSKENRNLLLTQKNPVSSCTDDSSTGARNTIQDDPGCVSFSDAFEDLIGYPPQRVIEESDFSPQNFLANPLQGSTTLTTDMLEEAASSRHSAMPRSIVYHKQKAVPFSLSVSAFDALNEKRKKNSKAGCSADCVYAKRLIGLQHKHERVLARLKAMSQRYRTLDMQHRKELNRIRRDAVASSEAGMRRLELQNANLRRALLKSKLHSAGGHTSVSNGGSYKKRSNTSRGHTRDASEIVPSARVILPPPPPPSRYRTKDLPTKGIVSNVETATFDAPVRARPLSFKFSVESRNVAIVDNDDNLENLSKLGHVMRNSTNGSASIGLPISSTGQRKFSPAAALPTASVLR